MNQLGIARPCRDPSANTDGRALGYARRLGQQRRRRRVDDEWSIIMEFPALLCVGNAELVALESYLGAEIDAIFANPSATLPSASPCTIHPSAPGFEEISVDDLEKVILKAQREKAKAALDKAMAQGASAATIDPEKVESFSRTDDEIAGKRRNPNSESLPPRNSGQSCRWEQDCPRCR